MLSKKELKELNDAIGNLCDSSILGDLFSTILPQSESRHNLFGTSLNRRPENLGIYIDRTESTPQDTTDTDLLVISSDSNTESDYDEEMEHECQTVICKFCSTMMRREELNSSSSMKPCGKCGKVWYCSRKCQNRDWPLHRTVCRSNGSLNKSES